MSWVACADRVDWHEVDADVVAVPGWCEDPEIPDAARIDGFIGCVEDLDVSLVERRIRAAGYDPLGMPVVRLAPLDRSDPERITPIVAAARARVAEYSGVGSDQLRPVLPSAVSRRSLLMLRAPTYRAVPRPDDSCGSGDGCRACVDVCPHGALSWDRGSIATDRIQCAGCGRCVAVCPIGAMVDPSNRPAAWEAEIRAIAATGREFGIRWRCGRTDPPDPVSGWFDVSVPCVGMLPAHWMLGPLTLGASSVCVDECRCGVEDDSRERARAVVDLARDWLANAGLSAGELMPDAPEALGDVPALSPAASVFRPGGAAALAVAVDGPRLDANLSPLGLVSIEARACTGCEMCATVCPSGALRSITDGGKLKIGFDPTLCSACGQCAARCPEDGAIRVDPIIDPAALEAGDTILVGHTLVRCVECGGTVGTEAVLNRIGAALGEETAVLKQITSLCLDCRGTTMVF